MNNNPFIMMFGKEPYLSIPRDNLINEIASDFLSDIPSSNLYIIIGARGSGKTVLLTELYKFFDEKDDWIVADVNPHRNILEDLASSLYEKGKMRHLFLRGSFDFSFSGISFRIEGKEPVPNIFSMVDKMLAYLSKHGKKVLVTLDEATNNERVREFSHDFQAFVRKGYPLYSLMTGLYENISNLQNDKSSTFLYRAPKILLGPLDYAAIKKSYMENLNISEEEASKLASLSRGYGYGYQLLGHLYFERRKIDDELLFEYDKGLRMNSYEKIYSSTGENERKILATLIDVSEKKTSNVLIETGLNNKNYSVYRERLIQKGVILSPRNGYICLALPRFSEFLKEQIY